MRPFVLFAVIIVFAASLSHPGILVDPGGTVCGTAADPVRPLFYVGLQERQVVVIDIPSASVLQPPIDLPGIPGKMVVETDGSKLYVELTDGLNIAVIDLVSRSVIGVIVLACSGIPPVEMAVGRKGRLYAACDDTLFIADTDANSVVWQGFAHTTNFYEASLAVSRDGDKLYSLDHSLSPASLLSFDVSTDIPCPLQEDCFHGCIGGNGRAMSISPDCSRLYVVTGSEYYIVLVLSMGPPVYRVNNIFVEERPVSIVPSHDGRKLFTGIETSEVVVADTATWLPFFVGSVASASLVPSGDDRTLAMQSGNLVELIDADAWIVPNRGGVRLRAVDSLTGWPVSQASISASAGGGGYTFVDIPAGVVGRAPMQPGTVDITVWAPGHGSVTRSVTVIAGQWTDVGDVVLDRTSAIPGPTASCAAPALHCGETADIEIHGQGFVPGPGFLLESIDPDITLNDFSLRNWSVIDANVTVSPSTFLTRRRNVFRITNPDGQLSFGYASVTDCPVSPPLSPYPVARIYVRKSSPLDPELLWEDSPSDGLHNEAASYLVMRSTGPPDRGYALREKVMNTPAPMEHFLDAGGISPSPPGSYLHFYKVSAWNCDGDSGDLP